MERISFNLPYDDARFYMQKKERMLQSAEHSVTSQQRIQNLRDDPIAASHSVRYQSVSFRLERFVSNIDQVQKHNQSAEGYVRSSVDILQKIRELAVQMSNGIYSEEERNIASLEIDQMLRQLVANANAKSGDGSHFFAGLRTTSPPFRMVTGIRAGGEKAYITEVEYLGDQRQHFVEVNEGTFIAQNIPGSELFWAKNDRIFSQLDASSYVVPSASDIYVDGHAIRLDPGDTVGNIVQKINDSPAAVRASLDPLSRGLVIETTTPHRLWLEDGGTVLQDLGIIEDSQAPYNVSNSALSFSGSVFDMIIQFQERLLSNDADSIGGSVLQGLDDAIQSLVSGLASYGALDSRLSILSERVSMNIIEVDTLNAQAVEVDYAEAVTNLRRLEYSHEASLAATARILQQSLLDYLR